MTAVTTCIFYRYTWYNIRIDAGGPVPVNRSLPAEEISRVPPTSRPSPLILLFFCRIVPIAFIICSGCLLFFGSHEVVQAKASTTWPTAKGVILDATVMHYQKGKWLNFYIAQIRYTYTAGMRARNGTRVSFGDYGGVSPTHAKAVVSQYPRGKAVTVRYCQEDPALCVLEAGINGGVWLLPAVGLLGLVAGIIVMMMLHKKVEAMIETASEKAATFR